jgi:hypothetical protein
VTITVVWVQVPPSVPALKAQVAELVYAYV